MLLLKNLIHTFFLHILSLTLILSPLPTSGQDNFNDNNNRRNPYNHRSNYGQSFGNPYYSSPPSGSYYPNPQGNNSNMMGMVSPYMGNGAGSMIAGGNSNMMMGGMMAMQTVQSAINTTMQQLQSSATLEMMKSNMGKQAPMQDVRDGLFPACRTMPADTGQYSKDFCKISSEMESGMLQPYLKQAEVWSKSYKDMTREGGAKMGGDVGLQCIKEQSKQLSDQLHSMREELKKQIAQIKEVNEKQKLELNKGLDQIKRHNYLLDGGQSTNQEDKAQDFAKIFQDDPACAEAFDANQFDARQGGLRRVRSTMRVNDQKAQTFLSNAKNDNFFRDLVKADLSHLETQFKKGVGSATAMNFPLVTKIYNRERDLLQAEYSQMRENLKAATSNAMDLPESLKDYERMDRFNDRPSKENIAEMFIKNCMNNDNVGVKTISMNTVYDRLEHVSKEDGRTIDNLQNSAIGRYKAAVKNVMDEDISVEDKINVLKFYETRNIKYLNGFSAQTKKRIYNQAPSADDKTTFVARVENSSMDNKKGSFRSISDILASNLNVCQNWYNSAAGSQQSGPGSNYSKRSVKEIVELNMNKFEKQVAKTKRSQTDIAREAFDTIYNCKNIPYTAGPESCNADKLNMKSESFCIRDSKRCAQSINACVKKTETMIKQTESKLQKEAVAYNNLVKKMAEAQNKSMKQLKQLVEANTDRLNKLFPKGQFKTPTDIFTAVPLRDDKQFGVNILGGGNFQFLDEAETKLQKLVQGLEEQEQLIQKEVDQRVAELKQNYTEQASFWEQWRTGCQNDIKNFISQMQRQKQQKDQFEREQMLKQMQACNERQFMQVRPGCHGEIVKNMTTLSQSSQIITPESGMMRKMAQQCAALDQLSQTNGNDSGVKKDATGQFDPIEHCRVSNDEQILQGYEVYVNQNKMLFKEIINSKGFNWSDQDVVNCVKDINSCPNRLEDMDGGAATQFLINLADVKKKIYNINIDNDSVKNNTSKVNPPTTGTPHATETLCGFVTRKQKMLQDAIGAMPAKGNLSPEEYKRAMDEALKGLEIGGLTKKLMECPIPNVMLPNGGASSPANGASKLIMECANDAMKLELSQGTGPHTKNFKDISGKLLGLDKYKTSLLAEAQRSMTESSMGQSQPSCMAMQFNMPRGMPMSFSGGDFNNIMGGGMGSQAY